MSSFQEENNLSQVSEFQENLDILRQISFFSELPLESLKVLAYLCTREKFHVGENIFSQKEDDGRAYYILSGKGELSRTVHNEKHSVRECNAGMFFGSLTLAGNFDRLFTLTATADTSCLIIDREKFSKTFEQFPDLMPKIIQSLATSVATWEELFLREHDECPSCRNGLGVSLI